jgi:hypothetical protein
MHVRIAGSGRAKYSTCQAREIGSSARRRSGSEDIQEVQESREGSVVGEVRRVCCAPRALHLAWAGHAGAGVQDC